MECRIQEERQKEWQRISWSCSQLVSLIHHCFCSAICDSQQHISPIGFLFWNFRHRLVRYYWYVIRYSTALWPGQLERLQIIRFWKTLRNWELEQTGIICIQHTDHPRLDTWFRHFHLNSKMSTGQGLWKNERKAQLSTCHALPRQGRLKYCKIQCLMLESHVTVGLLQGQFFGVFFVNRGRGFLQALPSNEKISHDSASSITTCSTPAYLILFTVNHV